MLSSDRAAASDVSRPAEQSRVSCVVRLRIAASATSLVYVRFSPAIDNSHLAVTEEELVAEGSVDILKKLVDANCTFSRGPDSQ